MKKVLSVSLVFLLLMSCTTFGITVLKPEELREEQAAKEAAAAEETVIKEAEEAVEPETGFVTDLAQVDFSDYQPVVEIVSPQPSKEEKESPKKETVVNITVNEDKTQTSEKQEVSQESSNTGIIILAAVIITAVVCAVLYLVARKKSKKNNERLPE